MFRMYMNKAIMKDIYYIMNCTKYCNPLYVLTLHEYLNDDGPVGQKIYIHLCKDIYDDK